MLHFPSDNALFEYDKNSRAYFSKLDFLRQKQFALCEETFYYTLRQVPFKIKGNITTNRGNRGTNEKIILNTVIYL